jgi:hypothetical protein
VLLLVVSVLLVLDFALFDAFVCGKQCCIMYWDYIFLTTLQAQIDTVTVEGVEIVGGEDWIEFKTEEDCIELVRRVKCEQEVSVLCCVFCGSDLCTGVCVCVCV